MDWVILLISFIGLVIFTWMIVCHYRSILDRMLIVKRLTFEPDFEILMKEFEQVSPELHSIYIFLGWDPLKLYSINIQAALKCH